MGIKRTGSKHDGKTRNRVKTLISALWNFSRKLEAWKIFSVKVRNILDFIKNYSAHQNGSRKIFGIDRGSKIHRKDRNRANEPRSSRCLNAWVKDVVSSVYQAECQPKHDMSPCMKLDHAAWHVYAREVAVSATEACWPKCSRLCVASHGLHPCSKQSGRECIIQHVTELCSKTNEPEACGLTHSRMCGLILQVDDFYKYPCLPSVSDIHSTPKAK